MKRILPALLLAPTLVFTATAAEKKAFVPHPVTATFYISNVQCGSCVDAVAESVKRVKSATDVKMQPGDGYAQISFDTHVSSYHQIAQAIAEAAPVHGDKYVPTLRMSVPDYAKGDNAAKVDAVFAKSKDQVKVIAKNREKGEFEIQFLPLKVDAAKEGPQGWNAGKFGHPVGDPAPKGLGLKLLVKREGQPAPAAKKK
ncbi:MAG: heavy-metal-associated domain-containing protein [Verrucomicrobia bacterium]|nr:heavy-metal-associated domain-containing protein [Verrucomicrobiota bacterium]